MFMPLNNNNTLSCRSEQTVGIALLVLGCLTLTGAVGICIFMCFKSQHKKSRVDVNIDLNYLNTSVYFFSLIESYIRLYMYLEARLTRPCSSCPHFRRRRGDHGYGLSLQTVYAPKSFRNTTQVCVPSYWRTCWDVRACPDLSLVSVQL